MEKNLLISPKNFNDAYFFNWVTDFLAILLVVIILLQNGKGADIGSAFGSGNNNGMLGPIESGTVLTTITWVLVFFFH